MSTRFEEIFFLESKLNLGSLEDSNNLQFYVQKNEGIIGMIPTIPSFFYNK
jgi:hypothetical protein